jgi:hypothetical protein
MEAFADMGEEGGNKQIKKKKYTAKLWPAGIHLSPMSSW